MFKLLVLAVSMIALAQSAAIPVTGGIIESGMDNNIMEIARWTTKTMQQFSGVEGDHTVLTIRNVRTQVVAGMNYFFTVDYLIAGPENKYYFKSCDVKIWDQPWTFQRQYIEDPVCGPNPNYPKRAAAGGWSDSTMSQTVSDIAKWSTNSLAQFSGIEGEQSFSVMTIRNIKTQVVSGVNYWFDVDLLIAGPENKYYFKSCNIKVWDQPWTNSRLFIEDPKCGPHPNYPNF